MILDQKAHWPRSQESGRIRGLPSESLFSPCTSQLDIDRVLAGNTATEDAKLDTVCSYACCCCLPLPRKLFPLMFVCFLAGLCKNYSTDFHKICWEGGTEPKKKELDFNGNRDHVTLVLWCVRVSLGTIHASCHSVCFICCLFNGNNHTLLWL